MIYTSCKNLFILVILASLPGYSWGRVHRNYQVKHAMSHKEKQPLTLAGHKEPVTIFVHGTLPPFVSPIFHTLDCPWGLTPARAQGNKLVHGRLCYTLNKADPIRFPLDSFYLFGWSGQLSFAAREQAAQELYDVLKGCKGSIQLIGMSHGCNVVLTLAKIIQEHNDTTLDITSVILLAGPVQEATKNYVRSPLFKKVISLYSGGDIIQIADPQGFYTESRACSCHSSRYSYWRPLFSERTFEPAPHLVQARIFINKRNPYHISFMFDKFMRNLPALLDLLEILEQGAQSQGKEAHFSVNIPRKDGQPHVWYKHFHA